MASVRGVVIVPLWTGHVSNLGERESFAWLADAFGDVFGLQLLQQGNPDSIEPVSQSHIIELSVIAPSGQVRLTASSKALVP